MSDRTVSSNLSPAPSPSLASDHFTLFGLPARQSIDGTLLAQRRRELQSRVHPDRFASEGAAAQRIAMQWAVRVNEAWQCLKDPLARAAYLCGLRGQPIDAERNTSMPAGFLLQQMAWREALDDARDGAAVRQLAAIVAADEAQRLARLTLMLDESSDVVAAAGEVRALMFVQRFRSDLEDRLHADADASDAAAAALPAATSGLGS
jgi:molecular chaperone HscB